ncbi:UDP-N-acetylmuramate dehydrogenase [Desulfobacula phenolica]|uniref:UDP-N-acetylenolpyruvoylglucosamine reductase n=1 Tax=Desulfobacula phenolica TaxID=90732 RepID=A0A1H2DMF4_9BACT|nr:UDP-N-acetylmuramate dehydrogenase [Desulfobacula phenolica]SDT84082.1 UDP-N-acetylmuramate dehydrogenase [Desulfobacula phenolica]
MIEKKYSKSVEKFDLLAEKFNLLIDEPLKNYTSFKVGGPADLLALPKDQQELKQLLKEASNLDIRVTLFGGGTNILISDKGIRGLVVITKRLKSKIRIIEINLNEKSLYVETGERLSTICRFAIRHSLSGLEFAAGIPGTIGGAIIMNAGTSTGNISDIVQSIDILNQDTLKIETIEKKDLDFSYRHLNQSGVIVAAKLILKSADPKKIEATFQHNLNYKNATQPVCFASAGCFFKNPDHGMSAGELIEKSELKGMKINDAMVSRLHANYIVNTNNARCEDILLLQQQIQDTVQKRYQIKLETEVRMEGEQENKTKQV